MTTSIKLLGREVEGATVMSEGQKALGVIREIASELDAELTACGHLEQRGQEVNGKCLDCQRAELEEKHQTYAAVRAGQRATVDNALDEYQTRAKTVVRNCLKWMSPTKHANFEAFERDKQAAEEFLNE